VQKDTYDDTGFIYFPFWIVMGFELSLKLARQAVYYLGHTPDPLSFYNML
jgi:hypothetical protein